MWRRKRPGRFCPPRRVRGKPAEQLMGSLDRSASGRVPGVFHVGGIAPYLCVKFCKGGHGGTVWTVAELDFLVRDRAYFDFSPMPIPASSSTNEQTRPDMTGKSTRLSPVVSSMYMSRRISIMKERTRASMFQ
jgi:hypothetical protein